MKFRIMQIIIGLWCLVSSVSAQNSDAPKQLSRTYLLTNCFVVKQPGTILPKQNVLIQDGFIMDVAPSIKAPFDAQIIKADSMYVYAGFIDGHSNTGIAKPENKERGDRGNAEQINIPTLEQSGVYTHRNSLETFKSSDKSVSEMRSIGVTVSQVAPRDGMLPGQSAIFLLGEGANDKLLLRNNSVQNATLDPARGTFPSTSIGVIAKFREVYKNANIAGSHEEKYKANAIGLSRPDFSKELIAFYPFTAKKQAINVMATQTKDVHKFLSLQDELGFNMNIANVKQGWHYIDKIKAKNIGVFLSLELPEEEKEKKDSTIVKKDTLSVTKDTSKMETGGKVQGEPKKLATIEEKDNVDFDTKRIAAYNDYVNQAAKFEKAGIPFAFSFHTVKPGDVKKNLQRMIKSGLSENAALAALTTNPAKLLGISSQVGTVEKGKIANIVITSKPYFDEKSIIKYVFVDGKKYDYNTSNISKSGDNKRDEKSSLVNGVWSFSVSIAGETQTGTLTITGSSDKLSVVTKTDKGNNEDTGFDIKLEGKNLLFAITVEMEEPTKVLFDLNFDKDSYSGKIDLGSMGIFPISGSKVSDPKTSLE
jgi:imidazolonepropionase-like amidohydrolase